MEKTASLQKIRKFKGSTRMGHRLTKIYTRTGDHGTTGLADGSRIDKDDKRVETMGDVDELNCVIGLILTEELPAELNHDLIQIQHILFNLGGEIAMPGFDLVRANDVDMLESRLDHYNESLTPLKEFILPGGNRAAAYAHLARGVCRRAERRIVTLNKSLNTPHQLAQNFLNRLSDFLFVICRYINYRSGVSDVLWKNEFSKA